MVHTPNSKYKLLMPRPSRYTSTGTRTTTTRPIATLTATTLFPPLETSEDENEQANATTATTTTTTRSTSTATATTATMLSPELRETFLTLQAIHREECRLLKRNNDEVDHHNHGHVSDDDDDDDDDVDDGGRGEGKFVLPSSAAKKKQKVSSHRININNIQGYKEAQGEEQVHDEEESKEGNVKKVKHSSNDPKVEEGKEEEHDESIKSGELKARKFEAAVAATVAAESEICMLTSGIAELEAILLQQEQKNSVSNDDDDDDGGGTLTLNVDDTQGEEEKNVNGGTDDGDDGDWKHKTFPALPSVSASLSDTLTRNR